MDRTSMTRWGNQGAGRVGWFLRVDDFDAAYARMTSAGVEFLTAPRTAPHGRFAVFLDIAEIDEWGPPRLRLIVFEPAPVWHSPPARQR